MKSAVSHTVESNMSCLCVLGTFPHRCCVQGTFLTYKFCLPKIEVKNKTKQPPPSFPCNSVLCP